MSRHHQEDNPFTIIASKVNSNVSSSSSSSSSLLDLWQPRDWPHRRGDEIRLNLHTMPLEETSPGRRPHDCERCSNKCLCIHDNVLCWKCKGTFCAHCILEVPQSIMSYKMETIIKDGFGKCPACQEPLRSIGMIDVFRNVIESISGSDFQVLQGGKMLAVSGKECGSQSPYTLMGTKQGQSLVQEAELALEHARLLRDQGGKKNIAKAIDEYTHVINAITYFASISNGAGLVLRPHDLLLIAHFERADLEGNTKLADAIIAAYPKASVRSHRDQEAQYLVSSSGFKSLFYPLPACLLVGSPTFSATGLVRMDLRIKSKDEAFASADAQKQFLLTGCIQQLPRFQADHPHMDGWDSNFGNLHGSWKGILSYNAVPTQSTVIPSLKVDQKTVQMPCFIQFVHVFPTATAAAEYTRIKFETKVIGEEGPPISAKDCPRLAKMIKAKTKSMLSAAATSSASSSSSQETIELRQVYALYGKVLFQNMLSVVAAVGNVSTKIFIGSIGGGDKAPCTLAARALVYLHNRLRDCRATTTAADGAGAGAASCEEQLARIILPSADLALCAFCGKDNDSNNNSVQQQFKGCSRCHAVRYCTVDCQRNHWNTKGPNSHKTLCKVIVAATAATTGGTQA